jgi:predicted nucleotidyltransferase
MTMAPAAPIEERLSGMAAAIRRLIPAAEVRLFGSRARGDWDGYSDTDLLVEAESAELAERAADQLRSALVGDDVLALDRCRWQAMAASPSPHWRAVHAQARCVYPRP